MRFVFLLGSSQQYICLSSMATYEHRQKPWSELGKRPLMVSTAALNVCMRVLLVNWERMPLDE